MMKEGGEQRRSIRFVRLASKLVKKWKTVADGFGILTGSRCIQCGVCGL
jgi:heterodisulfide reductase subunit C